LLSAGGECFTVAAPAGIITHVRMGNGVDFTCFVRASAIKYFFNFPLDSPAHSLTITANSALDSRFL